MKISLQNPILSFQGENLPERVLGINSNNPLNLGTVLITALGANYTDEKNLPGREKVERYRLAVKLVNNTEVELTSEEITLCKKLVSKLTGSLIYGQVDALLEGKPTGIKQKVVKKEEPKGDGD